MIFTSTTFLWFLTIVLGLYWLIRDRRTQNGLLLCASYVFYGWVHPWFCILIAVSTLVDFRCGLTMETRPELKRRALLASLGVNLGMLATFKYFNFFITNVASVAASLGWDLPLPTLRIFLPVGISFYTFQTLSYTIDVYRGRIQARHNLLDFAVFVSFFPQLVAGPIERAVTFLPQVEKTRSWNPERFVSAWPLILGGYLKKTVVADNVSVYVDEIFMLDTPSFSLLFVGTLAFAVQIYADFSAYTDIARGVARLLGFELMENFRSPYLAITPNDFWSRWHISLSSWIRDYLYIPMGGSRQGSQARMLAVLLIAMGLSGLWHGAAWNFVLWGIYHALLVFGYRVATRGKRWIPSSRSSHLAAWALMFSWTLIGWLLFRTPNMAWLTHAVSHLTWGFEGPSLVTAIYTLALLALYSLPLIGLGLIERLEGARPALRSAFYTAGLLSMIVFAHDGNVDFIYFRF